MAGFWGGPHEPLISDETSEPVFEGLPGWEPEQPVTSMMAYKDAPKSKAMSKTRR
jgi:hypothetical protein